MLEAINITKKFKKVMAVDGVNLVLNEGESVGLLGPNGAGKSTTISMLSTLMQPSEGEVLYNNEDIFKNPDALRPVLGVVPQELALYEELSAYENLKFFGKIYGLSGEELENKIQDVVKLVGIEERQKDPVNTYSGGMKRRVNMAVSLMHDPEILIMDEPTVGIDPQSRNFILDMVRKLNREEGLTVLYTSHYMEEVEKLCDRVYIMDHGETIASGTKEELKSILSNEEKITLEISAESARFEEELSQQPEISKIFKTEKGYELIVSKGNQVLEEVFELAKEQKIKITSINFDTPTLEDVFLHLTGRKLRD